MFGADQFLTNIINVIQSNILDATLWVAMWVLIVYIGIKVIKVLVDVLIRFIINLYKPKSNYVLYQRGTDIPVSVTNVVNLTVNSNYFVFTQSNETIITYSLDHYKRITKC